MLSVGKISFYFAGMVFIFATIASAGLASAETYQFGGSTATIHQSGGNGKSESHVTRYRDGQKIITRDGRSTDITIQRSDRFLLPDNSGDYPETDVDCFGRRFIAERFSRIDPDEESSADCSNGKSSCARDDFKQRMLDRMRRDFQP